MAEDDDPAQHLIVTKGAFANVLAICSSLARDGADVPLDAGRRAQLEASYEAKGAEGFRVLALATRKVAAKDRLRPRRRTGHDFRGFLLFLDPPKADAQANDPATSRRSASASR